MSGFTKLFSSIVASSIWCEDDKTRIVWITMLALADRNGIVEAALPGLANAARVSVEECRMAVKKFQQPDPDSRSTALDGRRVEKIEGGWKLLNYERYRKKLSAEDRREYKAVKQAEYRQKKKRRKSMDMPSSLEYRGAEAKACAALDNGDEKTFEDSANEPIH